MARTWIFQANPKRYDIEGLFKERPTDISWRANQFVDEIADGDRVYMWQSGPRARVIALATVEGEPYWLDADDIHDDGHWVNAEVPDEGNHYVDLRVERILDEPGGSRGRRANLGSTPATRRDRLPPRKT